MPGSIASELTAKLNENKRFLSKKYFQQMKKITVRVKYTCYVLFSYFKNVSLLKVESQFNIIREG